MGQETYAASTATMTSGDTSSEERTKRCRGNRPCCSHKHPEARVSQPKATFQVQVCVKQPRDRGGVSHGGGSSRTPQPQ